MVVLAFLVTLLQLILTLLGYAMASKELFYMVAVYGSPFYLLMHLFGSDSVFFSGNYFYVGMFIYQVIKYLIIVRAQMSGENKFLFFLSIVFEAIYLGFAGYYTHLLA